MYIRASVLPEKIRIAKSTLFKLIHDEKLKVLRQDNQFYIYWPDLQAYLTRYVIPENLRFINSEFPCGDETGLIDSTLFFQQLGLDARKWNPEIMHLLKKGGVFPLGDNPKIYPAEGFLRIAEALRQQKKAEYEAMRANLETLEEEFRNNYSYLIFKMRYPHHPSGETFLGIMVKRLVDA